MTDDENKLEELSNAEKIDNINMIMDNHEWRLQKVEGLFVPKTRAHEGTFYPEKRDKRGQNGTERDETDKKGQTGTDDDVLTAQFDGKHYVASESLHRDMAHLKKWLKLTNIMLFVLLLALIAYSIIKWDVIKGYLNLDVLSFLTQ